MTKEELNKQMDVLIEKRLNLIKELRNRQNDKELSKKINDLGKELSDLAKKLESKTIPDYSNDEIDLYFIDQLSTEEKKIFYIKKHNSDIVVGTVDIRYKFENSYKKDHLGNIGYGINPSYRGHHYSLQALELLKGYLKETKMSKPILTAYPKNKASISIIEKFGGKLIEEATPNKNWNTYQVNLEEDEKIIK